VLRQTQYGGPPPTLLLGVGADLQQAARARADPLDADQLAAKAGAARRAAAADPAGQVAPAAVIATAAVCAWLGAPAIRSRHTRAVRRAIDMTASIAGHRPPSHAVRGLA